MVFYFSVSVIVALVLAVYIAKNSYRLLSSDPQDYIVASGVCLMFAIGWPALLLVGGFAVLIRLLEQLMQRHS